jgi:hypothetical protein
MNGLAVVEDPAAPAPAPRPVQPWPRRLAARFALIAFACYHLPLVLNDFPALGGGGFAEDGLAIRWGHIFGQLGLWIARHVFGLIGPMPDALSGDNGDTAEEYCRFLLGVVIAVVAGAIWTFADRRRPRARWVDGALRVLLRYSIALGLASYAVAKILPQQFGPLRPSSLELRVGELGPFGLAWRFMEYSRPYNAIAGWMELAVVLLLSVRRTATLGALLCVPVTLNVALMNFCYGVEVKLFSTMTLLSALVLIAYDARPLFDMIVLRRATAPTPVAPPFRLHALNAWRWPIKLLAVGGVLVSSWVAMQRHIHEREAFMRRPIAGLWRISGDAPWRRVAIDHRGVLIRRSDDSLLVCRPARGTPDGLLSLTCQTGEKGELRARVDGDRLHLEGTFGGTPFALDATRIDLASLPLLRARFRWVFD